MKQSNYNWVIKEANDVSELCPLLETYKMPTQLAPLLWNRGIRTEQQLSNFFQPTVELLHQPLLMHDMEKAVARIQEAIAQGESILIYGDYDADGITSVSIMKEAIELMGGEPIYYTPNRFTDGYGPNLEVYKYFIEEKNISLIVTVDNGVAGHEAIDYAQTKGVDVIVTDHHELPETLPNAYAIVHPRHPEGTYPFGDLAGAGVAFKVATALLDEIPMEMLDLVAIGTIADLVSLTGENRVLVQMGLDIMKNSDRLGIQFLCEKASIDQSTITSENIGFGIGPRLNSIGRLGDAGPGVELLTTFDEEEAQTLATFVQETNVERQTIVQTIIEEALEMVAEKPDHEIYVLAKEGWHEGVLGIVASRVVQETGKPAIVLMIDNERQIAKGSGRSVTQVNLYEALVEASSLFVKFGGHHMAAGMTIPTDRIEDLQESLDNFVKERHIDFSKGPELEIDEEIAITEITIPLIEKIDKLGPFGTDNPSPHFLVKGAQSSQLRQIGAEKNHLKFVLTQENATLDCIGFQFGDDVFEFENAADVDVVGQLQINEWNGNKKPQMMLKDYRIEECQVFDFRGNRQALQKMTGADTLFVLFNAANKKLIPHVPDDAIVTLTEEMPSVLENLSTPYQLAIVDCPIEKEQIPHVIQALDCQRIFLFLLSPEQCYLNGMPTREQFAKLFQFIRQQSKIDVRYKLKPIADFLKIEESMLIFMIQVFFDLKFVTIESGVMNRVEHPNPHALAESAVYKQREAKIESEEFLLYSKLQDLKEWFLQQEEEKWT